MAVATAPDFEQHRAELRGHCFRYLRSAFDAEDAVQETMERAWRGFDGFEGRATPRAWLYSIATNVCLDMLRSRTRAKECTELPDEHSLPGGADPADLAVDRQQTRLALIAAVRHLPPRQRAVLIMREVLRWKAAEVAELLGTTVASVNSALQRARFKLARTDLTDLTDLRASAGVRLDDDDERGLLACYVDVFERFDVDSLISLVRNDAARSAPAAVLR